jgi:hypothetical protein
MPRFHPTHKPKVNLFKGEPTSYYYKPVDQHYDDFFESAEATDKGKLMKLAASKRISTITSTGFIVTAAR